MKKDIDCLLSEVAKVIKGGNFLYLVPKKERRNFGFIETALRLKAKKQESFVLACEYCDNKQTFSLLKNGVMLDLKIFLGTGEEKEKTKK